MLVLVVMGCACIVFCCRRTRAVSSTSTERIDFRSYRHFVRFYSRRTFGMKAYGLGVCVRVQSFVYVNNTSFHNNAAQCAICIGTFDR